MNDDKIKQYLLGRLGSAEAESLEEEVASDEALTEQALLVEGELVDDYAKDLLAPGDKKLFEENYLVTDSRRQKLRGSQLFLRKIGDLAAGNDSTEPSLSIFQGLFAKIRFSHALAFASIFLLLAAAALLFWSNRRADSEIAGRRDSNAIPANESTLTPVPSDTPVVSPTVNQTNAESDNGTPQKTPIALPKDNTGPTLASFTLLPGTLRSSGEQFIRIASATKTVTLRLTLPPEANKYESYNLTVKTANGQTISTLSGLRSPVIGLPANKLNDETHIIFLEGSPSGKPSESIAEYTFRVKR